MKYDSDTDTGTESLTVAGDVDNMTQAVQPVKAKTVRAKPAKAKPAKKAVSTRAKAKPAKKAVSTRAKAKPAKKAAKKTNGKVKKSTNGTYGEKTETVLAMLKKGVTRAQLLAKLGWNAINVYQFVDPSKVKLIKVEGQRQKVYQLRK